MTTMTTAERRGLQQISGAHGAILAVAADQRGGMRGVMAATPEARAAITDARLGQAKMDIATHLGRAAGCILLDPTCALPAIVDEGVLDRATALLVGLDASGWDTSPGGSRVSRMVEGVTARRVRSLGGTGGKVMVWLRPDRPEACAANLRTLREVIADFAAEDLLLVVEFLLYPSTARTPRPTPP
jgi:tagatose 1,6-diphosphate aldolase